MVDQAHGASYLARQLGHQIAQAQSDIERDQILETVMHAGQTVRAWDQVGGDRAHDKGTAFDPHHDEPMDEVDISERAHALYLAHESGLTEAPDKLDARRDLRSLTLDQPVTADAAETPDDAAEMLQDG